MKDKKCCVPPERSIFLEYVLCQQQDHHAGDTQHAGDDGAGPVQVQAQIYPGAEEIEQEQKDKTEQGVEQQLKRPFDRLAQQLEQQAEQSHCDAQQDQCDEDHGIRLHSGF